MILTIKPILADNVEQISTTFDLYLNVDNVTPWKTYTKTLPDDDLYGLAVNLAIPKNGVYYISVTREIRSLDDGGSPIQVVLKDDDENPILLNGSVQYVDVVTSIVDDERYPIKNEEGLRLANISERQLPGHPILTPTVLESGDLKIVSSGISPEHLHLDGIFWGVLDSNDDLIYCEVTNVGVRELIVPKSIIETNNVVHVNAVHMSDGLVSPLGKLTHDCKVNLVVESNTTSVNSKMDYYFRFGFTSESTDSNDVHRIELIKGNSNTVLSEYLISENHTILIPSELLDGDSTYKLVFFFRSDKGHLKMDQETIPFNTAPSKSTFYRDDNFIYENNFRVRTDTTVVTLLRGYVDKRADGRFLSRASNGELWWSTMEDGLTNRVAAANVYTTDLDVSVYVISSDRIAIISDGRIRIFREDVLSYKLYLEKVMLISYVKTSNVVFIPVLNRLVWSNVTTLKNNFVDLDDPEYLIQVLPNRPDDIFVNSQWKSTANNLITLGGSTNVYVYDTMNNSYSYVVTLPEGFGDVQLNIVEMVNGDLLVLPMNSNLNKVVVMDATTLNVKVHSPTDSILDIKGIIKSNGVLIAHNGNNTIGYYI